MDDLPTPDYLDPNPIHNLDTPVRPPTSEQPLIHVTHDEKVKEKDPPMVDLKVSNPVTYLKNWLKKLLGNEGIDIRIKIKPLTVVAFALAFTAVGGIGFSIGKFFFPNSSPILHREIKLQGLLQQNTSGYSLILADSTIYNIKPLSNNLNLESNSGKEVLAKGNLTPEPYQLEISEPVINLTANSTPPATTATPAPEESTPFTLYSGIIWQTVEEKNLVFTSGKRKINILGTHIESADLKIFPQDFIDFYLKNLKVDGWSQVLYTVTADETIYSFKKEDKYITVGVKTVTGYRAYIEHN